MSLFFCRFLFLLYSSNGLNIALVMGFIVTFATNTRQHLWDRESQNTQIMQAMGMRPAIIWLVWMAVYVCNTALLCAAVTAVLKLTGMLPLSNFVLVFATLFNFGVSLTAFR